MNVKFNVKTSGLEAIDHEIAKLASKSEVWLANEILKDTDPYVPFLAGSQSMRSYAEGNLVIYPGPYARYLYNGKAVAGPPEGPKHATDKDLVYTKQHHPQAQSHWFEASKAQNLKKWLKGVKKIVK